MDKSTISMAIFNSYFDITRGYIAIDCISSDAFHPLFDKVPHQHREFVGLSSRGSGLVGDPWQQCLGFGPGEAYGLQIEISIKWS